MTAPVHEGDILAGKYRVERVLGTGGMGVVVAAWHLQLDERVAIKFLTPEAMENGEAVGRFQREARAAVKIKGEHVARVIDVGTLDDTGAPYMVMEYLQGGDLSSVLQNRGPLPVADAVECVLQASEAIAEAHSLGIIHRDLKPANLFLTRRPDGSSTVKVLDFGISKTMTRAGSSRPEQALTRTTAIMGSPLYMSPEQMASTRDVDGRTDIWALGAILYELLAGRPPFSADTMPQLCAMILQFAPTPLRAGRPDVPAGLEAIVLRCLEKDRERRPPNVAELAVALAPFAPPQVQISVTRILKMQQAAGITGSGTGAGIVAAVNGPSVGGDTGRGALPAVAPETMANWADSRVDRAPSGRKVALLLGGAGVVLSAIVLAFVLRPSPPPVAAASGHDGPPVATAAAIAKPALADPAPIQAAEKPAESPPVVPAVEPKAEATAPSENVAAAASAAGKPHAGAVSPAAAPHGGHKHPAAGAAAPPAAAPPATPPPSTPSNNNLFDDRK